MEATKIPRVKLGSQGLEVSQQGLGIAGMSMAHGTPKPEKDMIDLIRHAWTRALLLSTLLMCMDLTPTKFSSAIRGIREKVQVATKFAAGVTDGVFKIRGDPAYARACLEGSLKRLDVEYIDLYYLARIDAKVPIEITVGEMRKFVEEGKVKYLGLSEASAADIRRAHAVHPITAVQLEWSLWSRDIEEEVIPTCRELGIGIVPYSPLGRGFFSGVTLADMHASDGRKNFPRFQVENLARNKVFYDRLVVIGNKRKITAGQLALAWLQNQGKDVVPIPGTTKVKNLEENIGSVTVKLTEEEMKEIADAVPENEVVGDRYPNMNLTWLHNSSPPLSAWTGVPES